MITTKEVLEISERAMGHQALIEKYSDFMTHCPDPQVSNLIQQHQQILQRHHQVLMSFLNNTQNFNQQNINKKEYTMV